MRLKPTIIVRDEGDCKLLYNGENGGLISIDKTAYRDLVVLDKTDDQYHSALRSWLDESEFLADSPTGTARGRHSRLTPRQAQSLNGFYDLRSTVAPLNVLWAITPRCNLHCPYCFADVQSQVAAFQEASGTALLAVADMLRECGVFKVTLTGGECLLSEHVWSVAGKLKGAGMTVAILSNGTSLPDDAADRLAALGVQVGISLDGPDEAVNRITRGAGSFDRTMASIRKLTAHQVPTSVMVTLTRHNFDRLEEHVALLSDLGIEIVALQDLRPFGSRRHYDATRLAVEQERNLERQLAFLYSRYPHIAFNTTELLMFSQPRANGRVMQCPAGDHFGYIDVHGDFYPCTSLPTFRMGNLFGGASVVDLWQHSEAILALRRLKSLPLDSIPECVRCSNRSRCDGGCRGDALFYSDSILGLPSRCPRRMGLITDL
jgi:AdoMet-dependent heme synthase